MDKETKEFLEGMMKQMNMKFDKMQSQMNGMQSQMNGLESQMNGMQSQMNGLESQVNENTQILKSLEENAKVTRAEQDSMKYDVAYIKQEIVGLRKDMSTVEIVTARNMESIAHLKAIK